MPAPLFTYLALGDSYTVGEGIEPKQGFPYQLQRIMNGSIINNTTVDQPAIKERAINQPLIDEPVIVAKTGWTTSELNDGINASRLTGPFDIVTLLIGVNNQYRGFLLEDYATEFTNLLERAIRFAGNDFTAVFVLSIPDWSATPFAAGQDRAAISAAINQLNNINREIAVSYHAPYTDITEGSRQAFSDPALVASDGLHPTAEEYSNWAMKLVPLVKQQLITRRTSTDK